MSVRRWAIAGASGGIGAALVEQLAARAGVEVWALARGRLDGLPPHVRRLRLDYDDDASIREAAEALPPLDGLIVATGWLHDLGRGLKPERSLRQQTREAFETAMRINVIGPALLAGNLLWRLPRDRPVRVAFLGARLGSISDNRLGGWHAYRASKAALHMLVRCYAIELRRTHPEAIIVALHPGTVRTKLAAPFLKGGRADQAFTPAEAARNLLAVLETLTAADSGGIFDWAGKPIKP
ncbi:MAG: SDR family oxidoreductase [Rhodothalassiaceae bacterium]|nr:MAG: SDR family oxidoreductase [Rhodothalassiaceae bacterium]